MLFNDVRLHFVSYMHVLLIFYLWDALVMPLFVF